MNKPIKPTLAEQWHDVIKTVTANTSNKTASSLEKPLKNNQPKIKEQSYLLSEPLPNVSLSARQAQCLYLLGKGYTRSAIAKQLNLSLRTVETHIEMIKRKLNIRWQKELVVMIEDSEFMRNYKQSEI